MKVSIITSCYNRESTIGEAIESVINQDYEDIEYIVVDGASKDNSLGVIKKYEENISTIISEPDRGMYEGINKGIKVSTGEIIGLIHSDDFLYAKDTVSSIVEKFNSTGADIIYGNGLFVSFNNTDKIIRNWISGYFDRDNLSKGWLPLHPTVYIKKEKMKELGLYDESFRIAADTDLLIRYFKDKKCKIEYLDRYIVKMRMGGLSTDPKKMRLKWKEDLSIYRRHGIPEYRALALKILSKIPQFLKRSR